MFADKKKNLQRLRWRKGVRSARTGAQRSRDLSLAESVHLNVQAGLLACGGSVAGPFPSTSGGRQWASALDAARTVHIVRNMRTSPAYSGATAADFHRLPYSPGTGTWTCKARVSLAPGRRGSKVGQIESDTFNLSFGCRFCSPSSSIRAICKLHLQIARRLATLIA